jgi:hypothetical protein
MRFSALVLGRTFIAAPRLSISVETAAELRLSSAAEQSVWRGEEP